MRDSCFSLLLIISLYFFPLKLSKQVIRGERESSFSFLLLLSPNWTVFFLSFFLMGISISVSCISTVFYSYRLYKIACAILKISCFWSFGMSKKKSSVFSWSWNRQFGVHTFGGIRKMGQCQKKRICHLGGFWFVCFLSVIVLCAKNLINLLSAIIPILFYTLPSLINLLFLKTCLPLPHKLVTHFVTLSY